MALLGNLKFLFIYNLIPNFDLSVKIIPQICAYRWMRPYSNLSGRQHC